ncbi:hypothetical protein EOD39_10454 [Acipenser ruthenus]|uniref:RabBD domain-containing protein n=1 Tax=Acipenser ruthenus TaxID=7906 RepID=A0A662YTR9_ACIRT|nr:hypothetical protein EOD39_10454 [Acipenser ruthenus]
MGVLIRNVSLKEKDTNRIRCLFRQLPADFGDERTQRLVTGSWFEEAKAMRYCDGLNGAELVLASLQRTSRAYRLKPPANPSTSLDWLQNEQRGKADNARSLPLEDWFDHQEDGHFKSRRSVSSSSSEFSQSYNTNKEPSFTGSTHGLKDQRENHRDSTYSITGKSASALYQHRSLDLSNPPRFLRSISLQPFRSPPHRNIMEEMYIKMYFMNASQDVLSTGDANKMQWSPPRRAPPTPAPRSAYATAEDSDLSPNKYGGSLNNEEVVGSPLHIALFPSSTYETFLEENEQNGVDPVEDREPSIDTIDNSEEAVTLSKDDTYKLRGYVKKVITSTCMQMDDDVQERGEAILVEETVVDSASYQSRAFVYNSPVIPNEDLEQNDTEEENSTPSTASASEVSVRVDWSVNSVDSSSLDDQPRVQFALDFSQRSQKFQIYISQCKNLDRMESRIKLCQPSTQRSKTSPQKQVNENSLNPDSTLKILSASVYNSPVIPNEDLEQNDTEEENSTPSTASASEVSVRVDWSVNSVDSSSLDDQPRVQFALDFSQRSQKFQIYISQCKNLDRMEVHKNIFAPRQIQNVKEGDYSAKTVDESCLQ